jgi:hypothetical protein
MRIERKPQKKQEKEHASTIKDVACHDLGKSL